MLYENPKAKANASGSDRPCVALICTAALRPSRGIFIIPFFFHKANSSLTHLHTAVRLIQAPVLTAQWHIRDLQPLFFPQEGWGEVILLSLLYKLAWGSTNSDVPQESSPGQSCTSSPSLQLCVLGKSWIQLKNTHCELSSPAHKGSYIHWDSLF